MNSIFRLAILSVAMIATLSTYSLALTVPFTEDFTTGGANWGDNAEVPVTPVPNGGVDDGAYITSQAAFSVAPPEADGIAAFRAHNFYNSSGDAFVGNWQTVGVRQVVAYFRHYSTEPGLELTPFVRVATSNNFPGFAIEASGPIPADEWTKVVFDVNPSNPLLTVEGPPNFYNSTITNVGNVQFGFSFPEGFVGNEVLRTFDLDRVTIRVPEPGTLASLLMVVSTVMFCPRRRDR